MGNLLTRAREILARHCGCAVESATDIDLSDKDQVFTQNALDAVLEALAQPMGEAAVEAVARGVIAAWEVLPGQRRYATPEVQLWLNQHLTPAINDLRTALAAQPLPVSSDEEEG